MIDIVIPKLGMTMKEGTLVEWTVPDGARVELDDVVYVLSTEKLDTDVTAEAAGTVYHLVQAGETHPVSTVVGLIVGDDEVAPAVARPGGAARIVASPYARRLARERGVELAPINGSGPAGRIVAADVPSDVPAGVPEADRVLATPVARRQAEQLGIDLTAVNGTGPRGKITKDDVAGVTVVRSAPMAAVPLRGMRKVIADRMHASLRDMAQLTMAVEVDMTDAAALRRQLIAEWESDGVRISYTDLVGRAAVKALADHPGLNASVVDDAIVLHGQVHLGLAVAVPDGLLVPVITAAAARSLRDLSGEASRLAAACRDGSIGIDDLEGATFTITALGASGIDMFTPVINPPNVAILGIGRVHDGVAWDGDRPVRRDVMTLSLTIDHRAVDGAPGAAYLAAVRDLLESPFRMLV